MIAISLPSGLFSSQPNAIANVSQQPEIAQTTQISDHQMDETGPVNDAVLNNAKELFFLETKHNVESAFQLHHHRLTLIFFS